MKKNRRTMKRTAAAFALLAVAGAMMLIAAPRALADESGQQHLSEARLAVEQSPLSKEAKLGILTKADRAVAAGIPPEDAAVIITRGLKQGMDSARIQGFLETATGVKEQNLPVRLVLDRLEQGLAKGIPAERIAAVTEKLAGYLAAARPMVSALAEKGVKPARSGSPDDAVETVARALEKTISKDDIMRTGEKVVDRKGSIALFDRAVDAMTMFVGNGMTADQASRLVRTAVDRGYSERHFDGMERYMTDELRKGHSMNDVVAGMESRIDREGMHEGRERPGEAPMRGPGSGGMGGSGPGMGGRH